MTEQPEERDAVHLVYVTCEDSGEALKLGGTVVGERLAACANMLPDMTSIYEWKGEIRQDSECVLILKTRQGKIAALTERLVQLHSYECPCVVSFPLTGGNEEFLQWVTQETASSRDD